MSHPHPDKISAAGVTRRTVISSALAAAGGALAYPQSLCLAGQPTPLETRRAAPKRYLTFEYFHPFPDYPEALVYQASDAMNRMRGRVA